MGRYRAPRLLEDNDDIDRFRCRSEEQTQWLRHHTRQANAAGTSRVRVVTQPGSGEVVAYYAWCMASIRIGDAPERLRKGAGCYPQLVALLTRLGVSLDHDVRVPHPPKRSSTASCAEVMDDRIAQEERI